MASRACRSLVTIAAGSSAPVLTIGACHSSTEILHKQRRSCLHMLTLPGSQSHISGGIAQALSQ